MPGCCCYIVAMTIWVLPTYLEAPAEPEGTTTALVSWQKKDNQLWLPWCGTPCANMHSHSKMEKRRSSQELSASASVKPRSSLSLRQCVSGLSFQRVESLWVSDFSLSSLQKRFCSTIYTPWHTHQPNPVMRPPAQNHGSNLKHGRWINGDVND